MSYNGSYSALSVGAIDEDEWIEAHERSFKAIALKTKT